MARKYGYVRIGALALLATFSSAITGCGRQIADQPKEKTIASTPADAVAPDGLHISWKEHIIDGEGVNGGLKLRGGDGLKLADLDKDGHIDIISVHEDSDHLRIAFGAADPDIWSLKTIAGGEEVNAIEDVAIGDLNHDGWIDIVAACEEGHLLYLQNPGANARSAAWPRAIPDVTRNRGSWVRAAVSDVDGDGVPDVLGANKGGVDIVDTVGGEPARGVLSLLKFSDPLDASSWVETALWNKGVPNIAAPIDIDSDGDMDILTGSRLTFEPVLFLQYADEGRGDVSVWSETPFDILPGAPAPPGWRGRSNVFQVAAADLDHDARTDLIMVTVEDGIDEPLVSLGWYRQPAALDEPWDYFRIGDVMPDIIVGYALADIDGDGDLDIMTGTYSGLNVIDGGYSGAAREYDDPAVDASSSVGRLAWFENQGDSRRPWVRHDISRRVRAMYDEFAARDMDGDGDIDFVATRGNSGEYDGVFWLEQVRSLDPLPAFESAREIDSRELPPPPADWRAHYGRKHTTAAPEND